MFASPAKTEVRGLPVWFHGTWGLGIALAIAVFLLIRGWERADGEKRASTLVEEQLEKLRISMLRSAEVLYSLRSLYSAEGRLEGDEFKAFVSQALERQPELQALSWNPVVTDAARPSFERALGFPIRERDANGRLVAAAQRDFYVPVSFIQPVTGNNEALGFDLSSDTLRQDSLERAKETGKPVGTAALRLAQDPQDLTGFLVVLPVFRQQKEIAGYAVAVFRVAALVGHVFQELGKNGIEVDLRDSSAAGPLIFSTVQSRPQSIARTELDFAEHRWSVTYYATAAFPGATGVQSWLVLAAGLAFTGITTAYLWTAWRRAKEASEANAKLQIEIHERKRAEESAARANKAKSDFLASMSHEIRTPLNAILGYTQLMRKDLHLSPEQRDSVGGIHDSGLHLLGLINEVLDLSKIEAGRMELHLSGFDLHSLGKSISATFRPLCAQKRIGLVVTVDAAASTLVRGDEGKIRQVLINLLGNAVKFTVVGEVALYITAQPNQSWRFDVVDSGLGIPDEERASIFEPFHQGKGAQHFGGTGLGLAIAHRQVELMGGRLQFESERGVGTRFFFALPLPAAAAADSPKPAEPDEWVSTHGAGVVDLPDDLRGRMLLAAELHSATALKTCLRELRVLSPEAAHLAHEIRNLMRSYDMHGIQSLIERVTPATRPAIQDGIGQA